MTLGELFAGIGGWSEAAKMCGGITPVWRSEIDKYKNKIYELRHPGVPNLGDIRKIDTNPIPYADIITVSFPCTDISIAGKGSGLEGQHSRLWFEAEKIIRRHLPRYIVIENSPILNIRGLRRILEYFAQIGYDAEWTCLSGTQFNLQHRRNRLFLVAYTDQAGLQKKRGEPRIFRALSRQKGILTTGFYPGWAGRLEIPQPRTVRSAYDVPNLIHRLECTGDAIIPLIGAYVLHCIKIHANDTHLLKS